MIKALLDTNIVLDAVMAREPFNKHAEEIFLLAAGDGFAGYLTASSMTDIYYIARKLSDPAKARGALRNLLQLFTVIAVDGEDCEAALDGGIADFEDALAAVCAGKAQTQYIISRDKAFASAQSPVPVVHPKDFIAMAKA